MTNKEMSKITFRALIGERAVVRCNDARARDRAFNCYVSWLDKIRSVKWQAQGNNRSVRVGKCGGTVRFTSVGDNKLDGVKPENIFYDAWGEYE